MAAQAVPLVRLRTFVRQGLPARVCPFVLSIFARLVPVARQVSSALKVLTAQTVHSALITGTALLGRLVTMKRSLAAMAISVAMWRGCFRC